MVKKPQLSTMVESPLDLDLGLDLVLVLSLVFVLGLTSQQGHQERERSGP